jgi:hypothetical protein
VLLLLTRGDRLCVGLLLLEGLLLGDPLGVRVCSPVRVSRGVEVEEAVRRELRVAEGVELAEPERSAVRVAEEVEVLERVCSTACPARARASTPGSKASSASSSEASPRGPAREDRWPGWGWEPQPVQSSSSRARGNSQGRGGMAAGRREGARGGRNKNALAIECQACSSRLGPPLTQAALGPSWGCCVVWYLSRNARPPYNSYTNRAIITLTTYSPSPSRAPDLSPGLQPALLALPAVQCLPYSCQPCAAWAP